MIIKLNNKTVTNQYGYTLVQTMVSLSIIALVATLGVSKGMPMITKSTIRSAQDHLTQDLRLSRAFAKSNSVTVYLCPSKNSVDCEKSKQWNTGWIAFGDANKNKSYDSNESVVTSYQPAQALSINISLHAAGRAKQVKIDRYGTIRTSGNIRICDPTIQLEKIQTIKLNNKGRIAKELRKIDCG